MNRPLLATKHQTRKIQTSSKTCQKCGEVKDLSAFCKDKYNKDGLSRKCRTCNNARHKVWREQPGNKERIYAYCKTWRDSHPEYCKLTAERATQWKNNNKEKYQASYFKWVEANRDKVNRYSRKSNFKKSYGPNIEFKDDPLMQTKNRFRAANALGFRSGLEVRLVREMEEQRFMMGTDFTYEEKTIRYNQPEESKRYTPDFILSNGIVIEAKGEWKTADRKKITLVKTQYPDLDLRMVFSNADQKISKQSRTTYRDICTKLKIPCVSKSVPLAWLQEAPVACRLDALEAACGHTKL